MDAVWQAVLTFTIFIIFATFHEYAHGWMANRLGDSTALLSGRLSLNPIVHIDLIWTIIIPAMLLISSHGRFAFGAAKPVPVNPFRLRRPKQDMIWVGLAGPATNVIWALILIFLTKMGFRTGVFTLNPMYRGVGPVCASPIYLLLFMCVTINIVLLVFNMLPIPPLDGSRVLEGLLPDKYSEEYSRLGRYGFLILLALMFFGVLGQLLGFVLGLVMNGFSMPYPQSFL
jgi:Zn-dependent protease